MTHLNASLDLVDFLIIAAIVFLFTRRSGIAARQPDNSRRLERKLDLIIAHLGISVPPGLMLPSGRAMSIEVQDLAKRSQKIPAIALHREENPGLGLAEAKADVDAFIASAK